MLSKRILPVLFVLLFVVILLFTACTPETSTTTYTITATAGTGGSITPSGSITIAQGDSQSFNITPNNGYVIIDVSVDGESIGPESNYTFPDVQEDHTISASFIQQSQDSFTITATAGTGGNINPKKDVQVNKGDDQSFTITPDTGYEIADVLVDGSSQGPITFYTFEDVQKNHTIQTSFSPKEYTVTLSIVPYTEFGVAVDGEGSYSVGESVTITAATDSTRTFDYWYDQVNHQIISTDATYNFNMLANDVHYAAYWHYAYLD